jgi:SAM-dependent methyltransferase
MKMDGTQETKAEFDGFAEDYDELLGRGLRLSGEGKEYFAEGRMRHLRRVLADRGLGCGKALDFGCGTGTATPYFFGVLGAERLVGVDPSERSLQQARARWGGEKLAFATTADEGEEDFDLAFCNGVFHHIPPEDRAEALRWIWRRLRPGGCFAFWENNPWNPLTRLAMARVPFDADAVLVWPSEARRLLRENGFEVLGTDYVFFFPRFLASLRPLEPRLAWLPLGGQYLVLARK